MKRAFLLILGLAISLSSLASEKVYLWPKGKMPDAQTDRQIAAMTELSEKPGFKADKYRMPYIEWMEAPDPAVKTDACMILISGGGYYCTCDMTYLDQWCKRFTELGIQCVKLVYRTPRPEGIPYYMSAWEDGQRAVRLVRKEAAKRGFSEEKIGTVSMSAGSHLAMLLATSSQTPAYEKIDKIDDIPCHINLSIAFAPAYVTSDAEGGLPARRLGYGPDVTLSDIFKFDSKTCPVSLHHGGNDEYSPNGSTLLYRGFRRAGVPAELHIHPDQGHTVLGLERGVEFMRQIGFLGEVGEEVPIMSVYASDDARESVIKESIWPQDKMPDAQSHQCEPYIEWHFPKVKTTDAIQIIYSGGSYEGNDPDGFEVAPARRYLNEKGMTVVTLKYRTPRPQGLAKHITAWEDLQRTIKIVRSKAASYGLDPDRIGIMGCSAGGHLTLMGVTSSMHQAYLPIDETDKTPCNVQWGVGIYPAYSLTDGLEEPNSGKGNDDSAVITSDYSFDLNTAPMIFIHGDADVWASMNSVKIWEKMRAMGIQCELHTLALRDHCFQYTATPGTGSFTYMDRIWEFLEAKKLL